MQEWQPLLFALAGVLLVLVLSWGPHVQADDLPFPTVPSPTPPPVPTPPREVAPRPPTGESSGGVALIVRNEVVPPDVLPGEEIQFRLRLTNTSEVAIPGIVLTDRLNPLLQLSEVQATQGAAQVEGQSILVHIGILEAGQADLIIIRATVSPEAQNGQIILNQANVYFEAGQTSSNVAAAGLPPDKLPATGQDRREP